MIERQLPAARRRPTRPVRASHPGAIGVSGYRFRRPSPRWSLLALLLASACMTPSTMTPSTRHQRATYQPPQTVSGRQTFAAGSLPPEREVELLRDARTPAGLLRRAWLQLELHRYQDARDSSAAVLYAPHKPSANDESFARYLRAEAFRRQGQPERGRFDRARARELAFDPELQRRLQPERAAPEPTASPWGRLSIQPRDAWQPRPANRRKLDPMQRPSRVTIHHSAMYFRETRPRAAAAQIARIQREHMQNRGYGDIGYHFLIDPSGRIWEGRALRWQGAHASGANNVGNIGICLLGNFVRDADGQGPSRAQITAMEHLVVRLMQHYRFGPEALYCHSDFKATACPGPRMRPLVRQLARRLRASGSLLARAEDDE